MSSSQRYRRPAKENAPTDTTTSSIPPTSTGAKEKAELKQAVKEQAAATSNGLSVLDVLRILGGIVLLSCGLSYLSTSGESMTWGYNAWWTRAREWKTLMVHIYPLNPPHASKQDKSLTNQTARPSHPHGRRTRPLRRQRPHQAHLPRPQRHNLRRLHLAHDLRTRWLLPLLRRQRRRARLPHRLFRRRQRPRSARRRANVHPHRP